MIDTGLRDKVVLISGANNPIGIGAAAARALAREGARVAITYLRLTPAGHAAQSGEEQQANAPGLAYYHALRMQSADGVVKLIHSENGQVAAREADLNQAASIHDLFDWVEMIFGPVDILVNNAAHYDPSDTIFTLSPDVYDATFDVNARAALLLIAEFVRRYQLRQGQSGRIINLSTDSAQTFPGQIAYGASKAAIEAFTRSIAIEVGPLGITVNAIAPGPVQTGYISAAFEAQISPSIPLQRIGQPEDIADVIVFLASEQARWLTGQVIKVSGGHAL